MRDHFRSLDRLDVRRMPGGHLAWTYTAGTYRIARAAIIVASLAVVVAIIAGAIRFPAVLVAVVGTNAVLSRGRRQGALAASTTIDFAQRAVQRTGEQVGEQRWRVEGPDASALAAQLEQWRLHGVPAAALTAEPDDVPTESWAEGQPWPAPPAELAEPWPVFDQRRPE
ncbi:MAG: hypothetical protein KDB60_07180 [Propionibacteriaceae bacterium]|nr:hypothetical protein [Propionibacteriaceae bacterium]